MFRYRFVFSFCIAMGFLLEAHAQIDSTQKKIPPQVYGRPRKKVDSLAIAKRMQEIERNEKLQLASTPELPSAPIETAPPLAPVETQPEQEQPNPSTSKPLLTATTDNPAASPSSLWSLEQCVQHARAHNLQVKTAELNQRLAILQNKQARGSKLPSLNADATVGDSYGRSIDPTSNQFVTKGFIYNSFGLNTQALLFGWFQRKYQVQQSELDIRSTVEDNEQLRDDISLNVATGYLRVLMAREQVKLAEAQLELDKKQLLQTEKFTAAGTVPELNLTQMQSQLANDSATLIRNLSEKDLALLQLKALLNLNFDEPFDIETPPIDLLELTENYAALTPSFIYDKATQNQHRYQGNKLKLASAEKALRIAKTAAYPQLSVFGSVGTNFSSNVQNVTGQVENGEQFLGNVKIADTLFPLTIPSYKYLTSMKPIFDQYGENIRANIGLSLVIPILNGRTASINVERARIGILSQQLLNYQDAQKLKQDIYTAHQQALSAQQQFIATQRTQNAARRSLDFAVKRYAVGMITTFEYMSVQNTFNNACSQVQSAKYDLIFKLKVLDYYMGNSIKL
jgi:outer membrane protein